MREILFRGKKYSDEWVNGNLFVDNKKEKYEICTGYFNHRINVQVIPQTIGQFVGLTDKNGKKIFEGDIVKSCESENIHVVKYFGNDNYPAFDCIPQTPMWECNILSFLVNTEGCEVIGNIFDNPELINLLD